MTTSDLNEMGITNPQFPNETCPQGNCALLETCPPPGPKPLNDDGEGVDKFTDFMTFLAPPPRASTADMPNVKAGEQLFQNIGCASCHLPTLQTGKNPVNALDQMTFHPYSDFLLHDMGSLGDNRQLLGLARVDQTQHIECKERVTATHAKIMPATGNLQNHIRNPGCGQTQDICDDPAPLHASKHVFHNDADTGDKMMEELVPNAQLLAPGLFLGCCVRIPAGS